MSAAGVDTSPEAYRALTRRVTPRPTTWEGFIGNAAAASVLRDAVAVAQQLQRPVPHTLLFGSAGQGKTTLAKLVSQSTGGTFFEMTPAALKTPMDLARLVLRLNNGYEATGKPSVVFVDELHCLGQDKSALEQEALFTLLEDWWFAHNLRSKPVPDRPGMIFTADSLPAWPFTCIGATTEPGLLVPPLLRRFILHVELQPYTDADIATILEGQARMLGIGIEPGAAATLARFSRRTPGRAFQLIKQAEQRAILSGGAITPAVAEDVIRRLELFPQGLTATDLRVLRALADRPKGMGQLEIARAIGIALSTFSQICEPWLRECQMIQTLHRRFITPTGLRYLAALDLVDPTRPDVRAALAQRGPAA